MIAAPAVFAQIGAADFTKSPLSKDPASIEAGRKLSDCHGPTGEGGRGPNLMTGRQVKRFGDDVFFQSIRKGLPGTDMPPTPLPDEKVWQLSRLRSDSRRR